MSGIQMTRRELLKAGGVYGLGLAGGLCCPDSIRARFADPVVDVGSRRQLFLDDVVVERMEGVYRVLNQPVKSPHNPLVEMNQPWEADMHFGNSTNVVYDEEQALFKMWNQVVDYDWSEKLLGYHESEDGLRWRKPAVGQFDYHSPATKGTASRQHNFVFGRPVPAGAPGVFKDLHEQDPAKRYKMLYNREKPQRGVWAAHSPDGIQWTDYPHPKVNPVYLRNDTHQVVFWDEQRGRYIAHIRLWPPVFQGTPGFPGTGKVRTAGIATSADFLQWDAPKQMGEPVDANQPYILIAPDERDGPGVRGFYSLETLPYHGVYFGFLPVYHNYPGMEHHMPPAGRSARTPWLDTIDIQLAFSRDGRAWQRVGDRRPFIPLGGKDAFDSAMIFVSQLPIVREDRGEIWIYYVGYRKGHWAVRRGENQASAIGLAVLRQDGFVSLTAGNGSVLTKPLTFTGNRLVINAQTRGASGTVAVSILDPTTCKALPGFSESDCDAFSGDAIRHVVSWKGRSDVREMAGKTVRLQIQLQSAKLYAFQFTADEATDERS